MVSLDYQGNKGYNKATSTGITADNMTNEIDSLSDKVKAANTEVIELLNKINGDPNAIVTMYRATIGDEINNGDWVFLDFTHADRWTKTFMGTPKPNTKVIEKQVKAKDIDWTGKNLEFMYNPKN